MSFVHPDQFFKSVSFIPGCVPTIVIVEEVVEEDDFVGGGAPATQLAACSVSHSSKFDSKCNPSSMEQNVKLCIEALVMTKRPSVHFPFETSLTFVPFSNTLLPYFVAWNVHSMVAGCKQFGSKTFCIIIPNFKK